MSLINDALKQARQAPPGNTPNSLPPLRPHADDSPSFIAWIIPALVIILIIAAIFFIGWAAAHHTVHSIVNAPNSDATSQPAASDLPPVVAHAPEPPPPPVQQPDLPKLQGIFYSPTAPSAILDGKTVQPGDQFNQYKVKEISKYTVTLIGPDNKEVKLGMGD